MSSSLATKHKSNLNDFQLIAASVGHSFGRNRKIFSEISFELSGGGIIGIAGANGSGKSTLVKILCGALSPSSGSVKLSVAGHETALDDYRLHCGLVAPYLTLYEEFTPTELFTVIQKMRGLPHEEARSTALLEMFSIAKRRHDYIKTFSSGMKQRIKYILAALHRPEILFLDEPSTNLDAPGRDAAAILMKEHLTSGGGIILATNEPHELSLCSSIVSIG